MTPPTSLRNPFHRLRWISIYVLLTPLCSPGQSGEISNEPVFEMSPFEVSASDDGSYIAKNAISATKFDTPLKDLPISLQVITDAFMEDTFSLDLESAMEYSASVSISGDSRGSTREGGQFSIRGFPAARVKRDGVIAYYAQELTNIARVEVMKGPASLLYGEAAPGGIINYIPKRPLTEPRYGVSLSAGSYGFLRGELEATGPLIHNKDGDPKLLYRIDTSHEEADGWKSAEEMNKDFFSTMLEYRFTPRMKVTLQYEYLDSDRITVHGVPIYSSLAREQWLAAPDDSNLKRLGSTDGGSGGTVLLRSENYGIFTEATIGDLINDPRVFLTPNGLAAVVIDSMVDVPYDFVGEHPLDFNHTTRNLFSLDLQTPLPWDNWFLRVFGVYDEPTLDIRETRPIRFATYGGNALRYGSTQFSGTKFTNETLHLQFNITGKWEIPFLGAFNQTVIGGELRDDSFRAYLFSSLAPPEVSSIGTVLLPIDGFALNPSQALDLSSLTPRDLAIGNHSNFDFRDPQSRGFYISNLSSFWNDRIKLLVGLRNDRSFQKVFTETGEEDRSVAGGGVVSEEDRGWVVSEKNTPQYGIIYQLNDSISLYALHSESFVPDSGSLERFDREANEFFSIPRSPVEGKSDEYGVKVDFWDSKLSGTLTYFEIINVGSVVRRLLLDENGNPVPKPNDPVNSVFEQFQDGTRISEGFDVDLSYSPFPEFQLIFGYAYIETTANIGLSEGQGSGEGTVTFKDVSGVPDHQASVWAKYTFSEGDLEGLSLGLGFTYTGERRLYDPSVDKLAIGVEDVNIFGDPYIKTDFRIAYDTWIKGNKATVSLNVKNVTDEENFNANGMPIDPRQFFFTLKYAF